MFFEARRSQTDIVRLKGWSNILNVKFKHIQVHTRANLLGHACSFWPFDDNPYKQGDYEQILLFFNENEVFFFNRIILFLDIVSFQKIIPYFLFQRCGCEKAPIFSFLSIVNFCEIKPFSLEYKNADEYPFSLRVPTLRNSVR